MKSTLFWLLVILTIGVGHAPETQARESEIFKKLDANRDNRLSEGEFVGEKAGKARAKARKKFRTLDKNGDKSLSLNEFSERL